MSPLYVLTRGAEEDLRSIVRFTVKQWGQRQCRVYIAELEARIEALARGQGVFKDMSALLPGLRVAACARHLIFLMPRPDAPALVLAILHERMDILARLSSRLED